MTAILRVALLASLAATSLPAVAPAQGTPIDSLNRRVALLERKVADLEQRVRELEALVKAEPSRGQPVTESSKAEGLANWRRLSRGMTMASVRGLLGEPESVLAFPTFTFWGYPNQAVVNFSTDNKVIGWSEPSQSSSDDDTPEQ